VLFLVKLMGAVGTAAIGKTNPNAFQGGTARKSACSQSISIHALCPIACGKGGRVTKKCMQEIPMGRTNHAVSETQLIWFGTHAHSAFTSARTLLCFMDLGHPQSSSSSSLHLMDLILKLLRLSKSCPYPPLMPSQWNFKIGDTNSVKAF
jgi:hypothetical protein